jgi:hypothetical protein
MADVIQALLLAADAEKSAAQELGVRALAVLAVLARWDAAAVRPAVAPGIPGAGQSAA